MPATPRDIFAALERRGLFSTASARAMQKMCGFRTIAVHDNRNLSPDVLKAILVHHLFDLETLLYQ
ncbi:HepT-like ribonuclease domain-containing protein [Roseiflexus sp.]|uniref:HepT-like ribonuclease domain-containing protein n=1 Tax=Roseiflexus sp. TaxID=2562120 RepID=UPI00258DFC7B|nr:HepT-like ribonuclease domain-containing protein [Roseiflexus sp.]